jgi:hypothetical protein
VGGGDQNAAEAAGPSGYLDQAVTGSGDYMHPHLRLLLSRAPPAYVLDARARQLGSTGENAADESDGGGGGAAGRGGHDGGAGAGAPGLHAGQPPGTPAGPQAAGGSARPGGTPAGTPPASPLTSLDTTMTDLAPASIEDAAAGPSGHPTHPPHEASRLRNASGGSSLPPVPPSTSRKGGDRAAAAAAAAATTPQQQQPAPPSTKGKPTGRPRGRPPLHAASAGRGGTGSSGSGPPPAPGGSTPPPSPALPPPHPPPLPAFLTSTQLFSRAASLPAGASLPEDELASVNPVIAAVAGAIAAGPVDEPGFASQWGRLDESSDLLSTAPDDEVAGEILALQSELVQQVRAVCVEGVGGARRGGCERM